MDSLAPLLLCDSEKRGVRPRDRLSVKPCHNQVMPRSVVSTQGIHSFFSPLFLGSSSMLMFHSVSTCPVPPSWVSRSEEHTSELQSHSDLVCRLLLAKKKNISHM